MDAQDKHFFSYFDQFLNINTTNILGQIIPFVGILLCVRGPLAAALGSTLWMAIELPPPGILYPTCFVDIAENLYNITLLSEVSEGIWGKTLTLHCASEILD